MSLVILAIMVILVILVNSGELADGLERGILDSGSHMLSENMWFVWFKTSYSGRTDGRTDGQKCEDSARIREAGFAITKTLQESHMLLPGYVGSQL